MEISWFLLFQLLLVVVMVAVIGMMGLMGMIGMGRQQFVSRLVGCGISAGLGAILVWSLSLIYTRYMQLGLFVASLSLYHMSEYLCVLIFHYESLSVDSFLLFQSWQYVAAVSLGIVEVLLQVSVLGEYKIVFPLLILGLIGMGLGHIFRLGAILTAGVNFTHVIQMFRGPQHRLVTTGLYAFTRHPGYLGWYLWAVSSQIMMVNPLSALVYWNACYCFFNVRINYEEETLINIFGKEYLLYMKSVPTRIPGVPGLDPRVFEHLIQD